MAPSKTRSTEGAVATAEAEAEGDYLSKRYGVSTAIVREIIRRIGSAERTAVEREIRKGMARR